MRAWTREQMAQRAAQELRDGAYVNLGIGLPTLVANYIPDGMDVWLQSENGLLGIGPFPTEDELDADLINAGKQTVTPRPGASSCGNRGPFAMIRGGHSELAIIGPRPGRRRGALCNSRVTGTAGQRGGGARAAWAEGKGVSRARARRGGKRRRTRAGSKRVQAIARRTKAKCDNCWPNAPRVWKPSITTMANCAARVIV